MFDSNIGEHCQVCNIRDYLPLKCTQGCNKTFCKDCFTNHKCTHQNIYTKTSEIKIKSKKELCCYNNCKTSVSGALGIKCHNCDKKTCISHRHDHYDICNETSNKKIIKPKIKDSPQPKKKKFNFFGWFK